MILGTVFAMLIKDAGLPFQIGPSERLIFDTKMESSLWHRVKSYLT